MIREIFSKLSFDSRQINNDWSITRFVVLALPRTGSNYLCGMLNAHPQILCHHEVFHPNEIYYSFDRRNGELDYLGTLRDRDRNPQEFLNQLWTANFEAATVGFKLLSKQHKTALKLVMNDGGIKKVILKRRNGIKSYVSRLTAQKTRQWSRVGASDQRKNTKVAVNLNSLQKYIREYNKYYDTIRKNLTTSQQTWLGVDYEDLTSDKTKLQLLQFLDVALETHYLQPVNKKQSSGNLQDSISNFTDIAEKLRGTDLEPYLYSLD